MFNSCFNNSKIANNTKKTSCTILYILPFALESLNGIFQRLVENVSFSVLAIKNWKQVDCDRKQAENALGLGHKMCPPHENVA